MPKKLFFNLLIFSLIGLFTFPSQVKATGTTYYIDNCVVTGDDSNNGTDRTTPWLTINKVNTSSFVAGDIISFRKNCTWREELTVPSSGSADNPITFNTYGVTGVNPIINGSSIKDVSSFIITPGGDIAIMDKNTSMTVNQTDSGTRNYRQLVDKSTIATSATTIKIRIYASATTNANITGSAIGPQADSGDAYDTSGMTRITWDGGSNTTTITANTYKDSDEIAYALDNTVNQIISVYSTARNFRFGTTGSLYYNSITSDESQTADISSSPGFTPYGIVGQITSVGVNYVYTYNGAQTTDPGWVWENGTPMIKQTSIASVDTTAGSWYWDSSEQKLYLHAYDGSDVSSNGKTYEIYGRDHNIDTNYKDYITIDGIDCIRTAGSNLSLGGIKITGTYTTVKNLSSYSHRRHSISFFSGATAGGVADNITAYNSFTTTPISIYGTSNGTTIENSNISNGTYYGPTNAFGCIVVHGGADNTTIQNNTIHDCADETNGGDGIKSYDAGTTNLTIRFNNFYGVFASIVDVASHVGMKFYYNKAVVTSSTAPSMLLSGTTGSQIYNNSFYGTVTQFAVSMTNTSTATLIKNNIFQTGKYISVSANSETNMAIDYNLYYGGSDTPFIYGATAYNFADWKTNSNQDSHSLNSDPLFISTITPDFHLLAGSPAINMGTDVGLTSDYAGTIVPQDSAPELGLYEYVQSTASAIPTPSYSESRSSGYVNYWAPPSIPIGEYTVSINQNASTTSNRIVTLSFKEKVDIKKMAISLTGDFTDANQENYSATKQWDLCSKFGGLIKSPTCPNGKYTIYVKFYTAHGIASSVISNNIILTSGTTKVKNLTPAFFEKSLSFGMSSNDILRLQTLLATKSEIYPEALVTGYFGQLTKRAVQRFQLNYKVVSSKNDPGLGIFGPKTRAKFQEIFGNNN